MKHRVDGKTAKKELEALVFSNYFETKQETIDRMEALIQKYKKTNIDILEVLYGYHAELYKTIFSLTPTSERESIQGRYQELIDSI